MVSRWLLRKCTKCGAYTLVRAQCPVCGSPTRVPHPPKFSPEDKYGKYRRLLKMSADLHSGSKEDSA